MVWLTWHSFQMHDFDFDGMSKKKLRLYAYDLKIKSVIIKEYLML